MNLLYSKKYGVVYHDEYGVVYSEDKKVLLYFPKNFSYEYYRVIEECKEIAESAFPLPFFINSCLGTKFVERNKHLKIKELSSGKLMCLGDIDLKVYISQNASNFIKESLCDYKSSLREYLSQLYYTVIVCKVEEKIYKIPTLIHSSEAKNICFLRSLYIPNVAVEGASLKVITALEELKSKKSNGEEVWLVGHEFIPIFKKNNWEPPTFTNTIMDKYNLEEIVNWVKFTNYYPLRNNRYLHDIKIFMDVETLNTYPVILFPKKVKKQCERPFYSFFEEKKSNSITFSEILQNAKILNLSGNTWESIIEPDAMLSKLPIDFKRWKERNIERVKDKENKYNRLKRLLRKLTKKDKYSILTSYIEACDKGSEYARGYYNLERKYKEKQKEQLQLLDFYAPKICSYIWRTCSRTENDIVIANNPKEGFRENDLRTALYAKYPKYVRINYKKGIYYPDIIICIGNKCFIDIEIDEPYVHGEEKPIHYIHGEDEDRNNYFVSENWFVIRFAERQIQNNLKDCVDIVSCVVEFIETGNSKKLLPILIIREGVKVERWSFDKAVLSAITNEREREYDQDPIDYLKDRWKEIQEENLGFSKEND